MPQEYSFRLRQVPPSDSAPSDSEPGEWEAVVPEFPGLVTQRGATPAEAIEEAVKIAGFLSRAGMFDHPASNFPTGSPEPAGADLRFRGGAARGRAGTLHLRVPRDLHQRLTERSQKQGVSVNQYATYLLAKALESVDQTGPPAAIV